MEKKLTLPEDIEDDNLEEEEGKNSDNGFTDDPSVHRRAKEIEEEHRRKRLNENKASE